MHTDGPVLIPDHDCPGPEGFVFHIKQFNSGKDCYVDLRLDCHSYNSSPPLIIPPPLPLPLRSPPLLDPHLL